MLKLKRVYEKAEKSDGERVLVDRLWPRGMTKQKAKIDLWLKDVAPSTPLRIWFGHDPKRWTAFKTKYKAELKDKSKKELLAGLRKKSRKGTLTLVYGAKDTEHTHALVLRDLIK